MIYIRIAWFIVGLVTFSYGISLTITVQHLGVAPWDVLNVGLYQIFGFSIGTWNITIGITLIVVALILDRTYVKTGTFINAIVVGSFVDVFLWIDFFPPVTHTWTDIIIMVFGIIVMGVGGGIYNAPGVGSGPRDGFMLSISDKTGFSIGKVRIAIETFVLLIGLLIGGPVFVFTFIFTFIQSPIFQYTYLECRKMLDSIASRLDNERYRSIGK